MSKSIFLVFPHQLFEQLPLSTTGVHWVAMVEEHLFFTQYTFHKQKLRFHRASMCWYADYLKERGYTVEYYACRGAELHIASLVPGWKEAGVDALHVYRVEDDWLTQRLEAACRETGLSISWYDTPQFILDRQVVEHYFSGKAHFLQGNFYAAQRKRLHILMEGNKPVGGRWSFDEENRLRYPKGKRAPVLPGGHFAEEAVYWEEAGRYVEQYFSACPGKAEGAFLYPISHAGAAKWLAEFLENRFAEFGRYEDAIVLAEPLLNHSLLSVLLNAGLLVPSDVLHRLLAHAQRHAVPLNETEGFVRQLLGWREFVRGIYWSVGRKQRTHNFWNFERPMPASFYTGNTGIPILDEVIRKVLHNGYCHHIERLMVLSSFMLLCEIHPDAVYRWFMELFVDAYDWVMVPNVYGMGQFADGGRMSTKPYISGSNYLLKMSDASKGEWTELWDALYWRFIHVHRAFFLQNPRMGVMVKSFDRMPEAKRAHLLQTAESFLAKLS